MKILYIDESGDTAPLEQGGKKFLVLTGCIIDEKDKRTIETEFRNIKTKYYHDPNVEIKSNFLRYANPKIASLDKKTHTPLCNQAQYEELQKDVQSFLKTIPVYILSVVIDKRGYWNKYPSQNPYHAAYIFLIERFQTFLQFNNSLGLCVIDPREGRVVDKQNLDKDLDSVHSLVQWQDGGYWKLCPNIIEKVLFSDSASTVGIQIADLYCYPIFNVFEYDKKQGEYLWFDEITYPKMYYHTRVIRSTNPKEIGPQIDGTSLKFFPKETKKDFRFYE